MEPIISQTPRSKLGLFAKFFVLTLLSVIMCSMTYAQSGSVTVTGTIVDQNNLPLVGAQVYTHDASAGTITDENGQFMLDVKAGTNMAAAYIGYKTFEFLAAEKNFAIVLESESTQLEDLVVVAYGTQKQRDVVGSISTVKSDDLVAASGGNLETALQGTAAGLQVVQSSIDGTASQIKIRGVSSISSGTDPLWIIDGMTGSQDDVNINDVETINVLKDASATAIYGSRGSNGVIIVTTKRGRKDSEPQVSVNYKYGLTPIINTDIGMATGEEALKIMDIAYQNQYGTNFDPAAFFPYYNPDGSASMTREIAEKTDSRDDVYDAVTRLGDFHEANISIRGGGEHTSNYASATYRKDKFSLNGLDKTSISGRLNSEYTKRNVTLGIQASGSYSSSNNNSDWGAMSRISSFAPIYDVENGGLWGKELLASNALTPTNYNPLLNLDTDLNLNKSTALRTRVNLYLDYDFSKVKGLSFRADASYNFSMNSTETWRSLLYSPMPDKGTFGENIKRNSYGQQYHTFLTYDKEFGDHAITAVGGAEFGMNKSDYIGIEGEDVIGYFQEMMNIGNILANSKAYLAGEGSTIGLFARLNYKFKDRYLLGGSVVREGSSKFSAANRWGNFYSLSAGWIFSDEAWLKDVEWIDMLKLRGSFGETGNQNIPSEATQTIITSASTNGYNEQTSMFYKSIGNKDTKWEKTQNYDAGLDFAFFNNRLNGSFAYYRQNVSDMLMSMGLPASAGLATGTTTINPNNYMWNNIGDMYNQGFEFTVFYDVISKKDFNWNTSFNFTTNENRVTALNPLLDASGTGIINNKTILKKGYSLGTYYMPVSAGIDSERGIPLIYKVDVDPETGYTTVTDEKIPAENKNKIANRAIIDGKSGLPTYYGSWRNNFRYKQFDLGVSLYFSGGNYIYNETELFIIADGYGDIKSDWLYNSWTKPGDNAKYPEIRFKDGYLYGKDFEPVSRGEYNPKGEGMDYALEKADFLRIQDITLGYTLPKDIAKKLYLSNFRVYVSCSNIATITGFSGYNPDMAVGSAGSNKTGPIVFDSKTNPTTAIYTFGVDLSF